MAMKINPVSVIAAAVLLCVLLSGSAAFKAYGAEEEQPAPGSGDFQISKIVLCDPSDPMCKPCVFFNAGQSIRINVLQNYGKGVIGSYRNLILHFYDSARTEVLKAEKVEQFVWGPHINDKWLCFLPDTMDTGIYELCIVVKIGNKEFQKSISFSVKNPNDKDDDPSKDKKIDNYRSNDPVPDRNDDTYELKVNRSK
jgi:hypothetical protein